MPKVLTEAELEPLSYDIGVCVTHCCKRHGCKYGKETCVVEKGEYAQFYACEYCVSIASIERRKAELDKELAWAKELEALGVKIHDYGDGYDY